MKGMDMLTCASQASTAICSMNMDHQYQASSSSSSAIQLGGRAIDRHNPIIRDAKRFTCTSQPPPINPLPYHQLKKNEKRSSSSSSSKSNDQYHTKKKTSSSSSSSSAKCNNDQKKKTSSGKKSSLKASESSSSSSSVSVTVSSRKSTSDIIRGRGEMMMSAKAAAAVDLVTTTPPGSSRYLLSDSAFFDGISDYDPVWALVPAQTNKTTNQALKQDQSINVSKQLPSSSSSRSESDIKPPPPPNDQVVVLRVSLHCKGCEGKVRKHLSRMEGVTSFSIDFAAKKVTIVGDVTPLGVLASVSKVKSAQLWTPAMSANSSASTKLATKK